MNIKNNNLRLETPASASLLEILEDRIAPASVLTLNDVDGDEITIKATKGTLAAGNVVPISGDDGIATLILTNNDFTGANIIISVKQAGGDGRVNVGRIDATGVDLGKVKIKGSLGEIDAGSIGNEEVAAIKSLNVVAFGVAGIADVSTINGDVGILSVKGDKNDSIAGDFLAGLTIADNGDLKKMKIAGSMKREAAATSNTSVIVAGQIGSISVAGSIETEPNATLTISAGKDIKALTVKENISGGDGGQVLIRAVGQETPGKKGDIAIKKINVKGNVANTLIEGGYDLAGAANADAQIGTVMVGGNWSASSLIAGVVPGNDLFFGNADDALINEVTDDPNLISKIAKVTIKGTAEVSADAGDFFGIVAQEVKAVKVGTTKLALEKGASNDTGADAVEITPDFFVREV